MIKTQEIAKEKNTKAVKKWMVNSKWYVEKIYQILEINTYPPCEETTTKKAKSINKQKVFDKGLYRRSSFALYELDFGMDDEHMRLPSLRTFLGEQESTNQVGQAKNKTLIINN